MKRTLTIFAIIVALAISCTPEKSLVMTGMSSDHDILIWYDNSHSRVLAVQIPWRIVLSNKTISTQEFSGVDYYYGGTLVETRSRHYWSFTGIPSDLYFEKEDSLVFLSGDVTDRDYRTLKPFERRTYLMYTFHRIDTTQFAQSLFVSYLESVNSAEQRMVPAGIRSLGEVIEEGDVLFPIGTIDQIYDTNPSLVRGVVEGDSMMLDPGFRKIQGHMRRVHIPPVAIEIDRFIVE